MSSENNEFPIPFEESRRGRSFEQEEKASPGRLGKYLASRLVDRPNIGELSGRNRGGNRGINVDLPTGGKPGKRRPTGSRLDIDGDGWADEGTTNPVWVGGDGNSKKRPKVGTPRLSSGAEYMGQHQAPDRDNGAPLHELTANGIYPDDIYSKDALEMYGFGGEFSAAALSLANSAKGKPNKQIKVYRAVPLSTEDEIRGLEKQAAQIMRRGRIPNSVTTPLDVSEYYGFVLDEIERLKKLTPDEKIKINSGNWVTPIREYAVSHGRSHLNGKYKIISKTVPAKHLFTDGNSIEEWGYDSSKSPVEIDSSLKLSSGGKNIRTGNRRANEMGLSSEVFEETDVSEDDPKFFNEDGDFDADAYNEAVYDGERTSEETMRKLQKEADESYKKLAKEKYPDGKVPERFSQAKIQMDKVFSNTDDNYSTLKPSDKSLVVVRDKNNNIVGAARFKRTDGEGRALDLYIYHIASYGQEAGAENLGASIFGKLLEIANNDNSAILLESTPGSQKYWENMGFTNIDPDKIIFTDNARLLLPRENVRELNSEVNGGLFSSGGQEQTDQSERLSSGKTYQAIVDSLSPLSEEKKQSASEFLDKLDTEEFKKEDTYIPDPRPAPPRPPGYPELKPRTIIQDDEKRTEAKQQLRDLLAKTFEGEMTLDRDIVLTADDGTKLNIGNKVLVEVLPHASYAPAVKIKKVSENDLSDQEDLQVFDRTMDEGDLHSELDLGFRIKALPEYDDKIIAMFNDEDKRRYVSREDETPAIATAYRTFHQILGDDKDVRMMSHDSFYVNGRAKGQGLGSTFNARNEQIYKELDIRSIFTWGASGGGSDGAVHWAKNGFTWGGEKDKQKFLKTIDDAITNTPELFSDEDRKKISSLYTKNKTTGFFETTATAEELVDFPESYKVFSDANDQIFYTRPLKELVGSSSRLSSGRNEESKGKLIPSGGREQGDSSERLSSGWDYETLVSEKEKNTPAEQSQSAKKLSELLDNEELTRPDEFETSIDAFGDEVSVIKQSEERKALKEEIVQSLKELFGSEIELRKDMVVTAANGEKVNLGNKVKVVVYESRVDVDPLDEGTVEQVREMQLYDDYKGWEDGAIFTQANVWMHIVPTDEAAARLSAAGVPDDLLDPFALTGDTQAPYLGRAQRTINSMNGERQVVHDVFFISEQAQGYGIASQFNARNEQIYKDMGILRILTQGSSEGEDWQGATHWPRNGFTWAGEKDKQEFIGIVDEAIKNNILSDEERERISPLYSFDEASGLFTTSATAEELIDFEKADSYFQEKEASFLYKRDIKQSSERLSSGAVKKPSYPREPTLGAFLGDAEKRFEGVTSWEEFKERYNETEMVFLDYETTGLNFDDFGLATANGKPTQIGLVRIKNGKEIGRLNLFMNPEEPLGEWSLKNLKDADGNPITNEWLATQMSMADAHRQVAEFIGSEAIIGVQNATFDKNVLEDALKANGIDWRPAGYLDTREISSLTLPVWSEDSPDGPYTVSKRDGTKKPSSSLAAITEYLGVELGDGHHNADVDAFATSQVMQKIIDGAIEKGWSTIALDKEKRDSKLRSDREKFDAEVVKFNKDKADFITSQEEQSDRLSSGRNKVITYKQNGTTQKVQVSQENLYNPRFDSDWILFPDVQDIVDQMNETRRPGEPAWGIPSTEALLAMHKNKEKIGGDIGGYFWTRDYVYGENRGEGESPKVRVVNLDTGQVFDESQENSAHVRLVSFDLPQKDDSKFSGPPTTRKLNSFIKDKDISVANMTQEREGSVTFTIPLKDKNNEDSVYEFLRELRSWARKRQLDVDEENDFSEDTVWPASDWDLEWVKENRAGINIRVYDRLSSGKNISEVEKNLEGFEEDFKEITGRDISEKELEAIQDALPRILSEIDGKKLLDVPIHESMEDTGRGLLDSIAIQVASDGLPVITADPIPALAEMIPDKRDWRTVELPKIEDVNEAVRTASSGNVIFEIEKNEWQDLDGNVVARRVPTPDGTTLKYENDEMRAKFPLLQLIAPKGYITPAQQISLTALQPANRDMLPGIYNEAWTKFRALLESLAIKAGESLGDSKLFTSENKRVSRPGVADSTYLSTYIAGITNPLMFNMGLGGAANQDFHDLFGHLGTGRAFDRHGEWANDLAMMSMVDHPDSTLTKEEKIAVKHIHFLVYASRRLGEGRRDEAGESFGPSKNRLTDAISLNAVRPLGTISAYAGNIEEMIEKLDRASTSDRLSSGSKKLYDADKNDVSSALIADIDGILNSDGRDDGRLGSGRPDRPLIPMRTPIDADKPADPSKKYRYAETGPSGRPLRKTSNDWLKGLTNKQMSEVLVPESPEQMFEMFVDDFAPNVLSSNNKKAIQAFRKYWDDMWEAHPYHRPDFSPEARKAVTEALESSLDASPALRWAFQKHGAPNFYIMTPEAVKLYHEIPSIKQILAVSKEKRGLTYDLEVRGISSSLIDGVFINPKALIDKEKHGPGFADLPLLTRSTSGSLTSSSSHMDNSVQGLFTHEWAHWLHYRALRDIEYPGQKNGRTYYLSGDMSDDGYYAGLEVAQKYKLDSFGKDPSGPDAQLLGAHTDNIPFNAGETIPRMTTSYGHTNMREMIAEGVVAVLHPDEEVSKKHLNSVLRNDVYTLLGMEPDSKPWAEERLSSGAEAPAEEPKTGKLRKLVQKLRGNTEGREKETAPQVKTRPKVAPYEAKTENLKYFSPPISKALLEFEGTVPTEQVLYESVNEEITNIPDIEAGVIFKDDIFAPKASAKAKNMIVTNVADSVDIDVEDFVSLFKDVTPDYGTAAPSNSPFFAHGSNFIVASALLERVSEGKSGLFIYEGNSGKVSLADEMLARIDRYKKYQTEVIDKLKEIDFNEIVFDNERVVGEMRAPGGLLRNLYDLGRADRIGGSTVEEELVLPIQKMASMLENTIDAVKSDKEVIAMRRYEDGHYALTVIFPNETSESVTPMQAFKNRLTTNAKLDSAEIEKLEAAGDLLIIDSNNIDSPESTKILSQFFIERVSAMAGTTGENAEKVASDLRQSGKTVFDASTPEGKERLKYSLFSDFIHTWAISANNSNPVGLAIQNVAREMFGLDEAVGWTPGIRRKLSGSSEEVVESVGAVAVSARKPGMPDYEFDGAPRVEGRQREVIKSIMQAIYDGTQKYYEERGITHVPVWRGMRQAEGASTPAEGKPVAQTAVMRPLSSWTFSPTMANEFSYAHVAGEEGSVVLKGYVPVSDVFCSALTGFGCLAEDELVLLGRPIDAVVFRAENMKEASPDGKYPGLELINQLSNMSMDEFAASRAEMPGGSRLSSGAVSAQNVSNRGQVRSSSRLSSGAGGHNPAWEDVDEIINWEALGAGDIDDPEEKVDRVKVSIAEDWSEWDACREMRTSAYGLAGIDDYISQDPNITQSGGFFGNPVKRPEIVDPAKRAEQARFVMAKIVDSLTKEEKYDRQQYLYRAMSFETKEESDTFFKLMKVGQQVDIPLLAFSNTGPSPRGSHFLTVYGSDVLFVLEDFPGSYPTGNRHDPVFTSRHENDTLDNIFDFAQLILIDIEDGVYDEEDDYIDETFAERLYQLVAEYRTAKGPVERANLKIEIEEALDEVGEGTIKREWEGEYIPENHDEYFVSFDDDEAGTLPREFISGGRLEVVSITPDPSKTYRRVITLRQAGAFDPQEKGAIVLKTDGDSRATRLSSGKNPSKKAKPKSVQLHDDEFKKKFNQEVPDGDGDCFSEAVMQARKLAEAYDRVRIVHGYPLGTGGEAEGLRYPHAWVEFTENGVEWVRDYSNGNKFEFPKVLYYAIGNIEEDDASKYEIEEAMKLMKESQHYGPW
jgi:DNA polymerase III epsilon subunit-like protein